MSRARALAGAVLVVVLGLALRFGVPGVAGDLAGGACYALFVALLLRLVAPRLPAEPVAAIAFVVCAGVELFQLTGVPARIAETLPAAALVLGTGFAPADLAAYAAGAAASLGLDRLLRRRH